MVNPRFTIGGGRTFIEDEIPLRRVFGDRLLENVAGFPKINDGLLKARKVGRFFNVSKHNDRTPIGIRQQQSRPKPNSIPPHWGAEASAVPPNFTDALRLQSLQLLPNGKSLLL